METAAGDGGQRIRLLITTPGVSAFERELDGGTVVIGRSSSVALAIPDRSMSRRHAQLSCKDGSWLVEDLGSRNGTLVNGVAVDHPLEIEPGDVVELGGTTISVMAVGDRQSVPGPALPTGQTVYRSAVELLLEQPTSAEGEADAERLRRIADRLGILNEVHHALSGPMSLNELLDLILERVFAHLQPQQGAVFLKEEDGSFSCSASRSVDGADASTLCSRHLISEVVDKSQTALVFDTLLDARFKEAASLLDAGVRGLIAAPLLGPDGAMGLIVLCSKATVRTFTEDDMKLLTSLASIAAMRLRNLRLAEAEAERRRLERDIRLARRIQVALLPDELPAIEGYAVHGGNVPSRGVSGDFYEIVRRKEGREIVMMVADVSGKGIGASLLTGALEALSAAPIENGWPPEEVFATVSRLLFARTPPEKYATAVLVALEPSSGHLQYASAGHTPCLLLRNKGTVEHLESTGLPIGVLPGATYLPAASQMDPGETLVLYTDGITEAENPDEEEYGNDRLDVLCLAHRNDPPETLAAAIEEDLQQFAGGVAFADDRTILILRRNS